MRTCRGLVRMLVNIKATSSWKVPDECRQCLDEAELLHRPFVSGAHYESVTTSFSLRITRTPSATVRTALYALCVEMLMRGQCKGPDGQIS
jgi:hypothetical protein